MEREGDRPLPAGPNGSSNNTVFMALHLWGRNWRGEECGWWATACWVRRS